MNRAQRRRMMKTIPGYKKALKEASTDAVNKLEEMFRKFYWDDETLNDGDEDDDEEEDYYNVN